MRPCRLMTMCQGASGMLLTAAYSKGQMIVQVNGTDRKIPDFVRDSVNLASADLGAKAISATNDFFGAVERMLQDAPTRFEVGLYDDAGKWMDGWESTRRRHGGHDHAIVELAVPGAVKGFDIDTSFFTGNFAPACSIEACKVSGVPDGATIWTRILEVSALGASAHHYLPCQSREVWSHLRLNIYPDGGVARFRVYGAPALDLDALRDKTIDLAGALSGGRVIGFSDAHFGNSHRLLMPNPVKNMGDGWDTQRRRIPGHEWIVVQLGGRGSINKVVIDTAFHKGNYPEFVSVQGGDIDPEMSDLPSAVLNSAIFWQEILPKKPLSADAIHEFLDLNAIGPVTHLRVNIFPDGGIARFRALGRIAG